MAQIPQPISNPLPPATNGQPTPSSSSNPAQVAPISWEGDRMFNVYIHDYFRKRGFFKAAKELVVEAEIGNDASPPINARQGFLFEWWNVFWMFFTAKTTGQGPENVMLYFHWMQSQQAERTRQLQHETDQRRGAAQLPLPAQPPQPSTGRPPMTRPPLNGATVGMGVRPTMVNGVPPAPGPGPAQYPMPPPADPARPPSEQQARRTASREMRPPGAFPSPTMTSVSHPPQFLGRAPGPAQTPTQQYMNHAGQPPPAPPMAGRPASRSATPGVAHPLTHQSPALAARDAPPQVPGHAINEEMGRRFQQQHQPPHQQSQPQQQPPPPQQAPLQPHQQPRVGGGQMTDQQQQELMNLEASISRIPPVFLAQMKMEAGVSEREILTLSFEEKVRLNNVFKKTMENYNGTTFPAMSRNGRPPGPSQPPQISGMPMYPQHAPPGSRQPSGSAPAPRGQKRGSTSPTDEQGGDKDQSPPDKKRLRPSPPVPPMGSMTAGFPYGPGPMQQQPPMAAIRHPPMPPPAMAHMGLANQQIMGHPLTGPSPQNQGQIQHVYRQPMAAQHLVKIPPGMAPPTPATAQNRPPPPAAQQGKMMPPPPSPAQQKASAPQEKTAPSPAGRHEAASPSMRPASSGGAAGPGGSGGPATPGAGGAGTVPSPSAVLTNRISPSAAMNSLPRPQTSEGPAGPGQNAPLAPPTSAPTASAAAPAPAPPSASAPPGTSIGNDIFTGFFDSMDDQFGIDTTFAEALDPAELAQWIDMNPLG